MGVSASVCVRLRVRVQVLYLKRGIGYFFVCKQSTFFSAKRAKKTKIRSDLNPNTSDFSQNANFC